MLGGVYYLSPMNHRRASNRYLIDGKVMTAANLRKLHKYLLQMDSIITTSDELRAVEAADDSRSIRLAPVQLD
jgi:hypothetical protein